MASRMAIDDLLDEHEQSERVLAWLRANGAALVGGVALGLAAIFGWKWWQQEQQQQAHSTADQYQAAVNAVDADDPQAAAKVVALDGMFADLASLELAAKQVNRGQTDEAIATLRGIVPSEPAMAEIIDQRLARLLIDSGKAQEALTVLGEASTSAALEVRGDAHVSLGDTDQAREAYRQALTLLDVASPHRNVLTLKLTQVGGTPASSEATN